MKHNATSNSLPREKLETFLSSLRSYVILRNHDIWSNLERGGDIDILVDDLKLAEVTLNEILGPPLFQIRRSYVIECFFEWGRLDLLSRIEWRGASFIANKSLFLDSQRSELGFFKPAIYHEAVISWFSSLLFGGFFKDRYKSTLLKAAADNPGCLKEALIDAAGKTWGCKLWKIIREKTPEKSQLYVKELRWAVWVQSFRRAPFETINGFASFWCREIKMRMWPPIPWIAVLGPDGSGKTSVLTAFSKQFSAKFSGVKILHWRPCLLLPPRSETGPCTDPHGQPERGISTSVMKIGFLILDWVLGYWKRLVHLRAKGYLLFFDRHFIDMLIDPKRYRYGGPMWLIKLARYCIPQPDLYILLDAPADILQSRKQEVTFEETARQRTDYLELVGKMPNGKVVDASKPVEEVVNHVFEIVVNNIAASKYGG